MSVLSHVLKGEKWVTGRSGLRLWLTGMPLVLNMELIHLWNSILPEPGQPSAQLSKFIRFTACKQAMHATSLWYKTVHIPWLVDSYDTQKGKRWVNSNPPNQRGQKPTPTVFNLQASDWVHCEEETGAHTGKSMAKLQIFNFFYTFLKLSIFPSKNMPPKNFIKCIIQFFFKMTSLYTYYSFF